MVFNRLVQLLQALIVTDNRDINFSHRAVCSGYLELLSNDPMAASAASVDSLKRFAESLLLYQGEQILFEHIDEEYGRKMEILTDAYSCYLPLVCQWCLEMVSTPESICSTQKKSNFIIDDAKRDASIPGKGVVYFRGVMLRSKNECWPIGL